MSYRIIHPVAMPIDANDFRDAVKKYIKLNHFMNIEQIILSDQYKHMKANVRYYNDNNHRKASVQLVPIDAGAVSSIIGFSSTDPKAPYPAPAGFVMGPSRIGGPAGILAPAVPMVAGPAVIGGPAIIGPAGPLVVGGPRNGGLIFGARTPVSGSSKIVMIDDTTATTEDGKKITIVKIEPSSGNQYKITSSEGQVYTINTEKNGDDIVFSNEKPNEDGYKISVSLTDIIKQIASNPTSVSKPSPFIANFGPTHQIRPGGQIVPIAPINPVGTDGRPVSGIISTFGRGPVMMPGLPGMGGPGVVVGAPMIGTPINFGRGVI